ncbi:hypothetical protein AVEN_10989-1 [Araneus ventricosus]|uniref:Uncharacterized protein n=1 Tax=Araneus ventricosus TaxID=182803 RepID=A0A4Y2SI80_ARAVE|nr:hypothetical protein AVEN_10989-1 [Araneus ventricosus]
MQTHASEGIQHPASSSRRDLGGFDSRILTQPEKPNDSWCLASDRRVVFPRTEEAALLGQQLPQRRIRRFVSDSAKHVRLVLEWWGDQALR